MIAYICVIICHLSQHTHRLSYRPVASSQQAVSKQSASSQQAVSKQSASSQQAVSKQNVSGTEELCRRLPQ